MSAVVVIAYRDMGCPHRAASFKYVHDWYRHRDFPVFVATSNDDQVFSRAWGANHGISCTEQDIIIQSDPDSLVPLPQLVEAIELAMTSDGVVLPHDRYVYLERDASETVYTGAALTPNLPAEFSGPDGRGNVVVFSRATWEQASGFDERFGMWAGDDAAFAYAAEAFVGPTRRVHGDVYHLWHPRLPQSEPGHPEYRRQFAILAEYRDAAALGHDHVRRLVETRGVR